MTRAIEPGALVDILDRVVVAVCEVDLTETDPDRLLLDLTRIEADADTYKSTIAVLMKHLTAA